MRVLSVLAVFITCLFSSSFHPAGSRGTCFVSPEQSEITLTLTVLATKYCVATEDTDILHAETLLRFTNVSGRRIILFRGSNLVVRTLVSKSLEEAAAGKPELDAMGTYVTSESSAKGIYGKKPGDAFITLSPGGTFETSTSVSFEVSRTDEAPRFAIRPGSHLLQVVVSTWPQSGESPANVAARWADSGFLRYTPIKSEPAVFRVDNDRSVVDCSKYAELLSAAISEPDAVEPETGVTALMAAIERNDVDLFNSLLARGANVNAAAPGGMTALLVAAGTESLYVKRLIELGANLNVRTLAGQTSLTLAIRAGQVENVKLLIAAGAFVGIPGESGKTPLKLATELLKSRVLNQQIAAEIVQVLEKAGAKE